MDLKSMDPPSLTLFPSSFRCSLVWLLLSLCLLYRIIPTIYTRYKTLRYHIRKKTQSSPWSSPWWHWQPWPGLLLPIWIPSSSRYGLWTGVGIMVYSSTKTVNRAPSSSIPAITLSCKSKYVDVSWIQWLTRTALCVESPIKVGRSWHQFKIVTNPFHRGKYE